LISIEKFRNIVFLGRKAGESQACQNSRLKRFRLSGQTGGNSEIPFPI
jgi:hypothetical protein